MLPRFLLLLALLLPGTLVPLRAQDAPDDAAAEAQKYPPKPTTIARVMMDLNKEAADTWRDNQPWPRKESDYATRWNVSLPAEDVARVLAQRIHTNPALDGYVKWQLLSFNPDLAKLNPQTYRQIIATMPEPLNQPEPTPPGDGGAAGPGILVGTQMPYVRERINARGNREFGLSVVTTGTGLGVNAPARPTAQELADAVSIIQKELALVREIIGNANQPSLAYRDRLLELLPRTGGVRLAAMLSDTYRRMTAGDPTWPKAVERLLAEVKESGPTLQIDENWKQPIIASMRQILLLKKNVARGIAFDAALGKVVIEREKVALPVEYAAAIIQTLNLPEIIPPREALP